MKNSNNEPTNPTKPGIQPAKILNRGWVPMDTDDEEFLILNLRFLIGSGEKFAVWKQVAGPEAGVPSKNREASSCGKRWAGRRAKPGKGGQEAGKRIGFSHFETALTRLFPHKSMQVVDFPHLAVLSIFCEAMKCLQKRGNKIRGTGIITGTWAEATKENA